MYGRDGKVVFTDSLLAILSSVLRLRPRQDNFHNNCNQTIHNKAQQSKLNSQHPATSGNRSPVLGN